MTLLDASNSERVHEHATVCIQSCARAHTGRSYRPVGTGAPTDTHESMGHTCHGYLEVQPIPIPMQISNIVMDHKNLKYFSTTKLLMHCQVCWFIPTHDIVTSTELAKLFLINVFSKHGVPAHVASNQGSEFVSHFFHSLGKALNMCLHFTSGYNPEGDGQTERANQTLV